MSSIPDESRDHRMADRKLPPALVTACATLLGVFLTGACTCAAALIVAFGPYIFPPGGALTRATEQASRLQSVPTAGARLDFTPMLPTDIAPDQIPEVLDLRPAPVPGLYLSRLSIIPDQPVYSWIAHYTDGSSAPAQADICLVNEGFAEPLRMPLNRTVNSVTLEVSVYVDFRYALTLESMRVLIADFSAPPANIEYLEVVLGGAGGGGDIFQPVQTARITANPRSQLEYEIDFRDFQLDPGDGVEILVPVSLELPGSYVFRVQVHTDASAVYDDPSGAITLTSSEDSWSWEHVIDPRDHEVVTEGASVTLAPCP